MFGYLILCMSLLITDNGAESLWIFFDVKKMFGLCPPHGVTGRDTLGRSKKWKMEETTLNWK